MFYYMKEKTSIDIGHVGETFMCYKLAQIGIKTQRTPFYFCFDVLTEHGARIEVKTAHLREHQKKFMTNKGESVSIMTRWQFRNQLKDGKKRNRNCDFFCCVGLDSDSDKVIGTYVIPAQELSNTHGIAIGFNSKKYKKFFENWNLISSFSK